MLRLFVIPAVSPDSVRQRHSQSLQSYTEPHFTGRMHHCLGHSKSNQSCFDTSGPGGGRRAFPLRLRCVAVTAVSDKHTCCTQECYKVLGQHSHHLPAPGTEMPICHSVPLPNHLYRIPQLILTTLSCNFF